jgi:two-component system alkaline phosphatase synthesis response regulator PhoP
MTDTPLVLVIDDDVGILDALSMMLEDEGYAVKTAERADYAEALPETGAPLPDLIILDVLLSGTDGRTVCRKLKSEPQTSRIPVLMISAHPGAGTSVMQVGADAFLAKPFSIDEMLDTVAELLRSSQRKPG